MGKKALVYFLSPCLILQTGRNVQSCDGYWTICAERPEFASSARPLWPHTLMFTAESNLNIGLKGACRDPNISSVSLRIPFLILLILLSSSLPPPPRRLLEEYDPTIRGEAFSSCQQCFPRTPPRSPCPHQPYPPHAPSFLSPAPPHVIIFLLTQY